MSAERDAHFLSTGPKRILSLDGGGTLGVIELAFLERIESLLRASRGGDPDFRLCHWFDLIGGTSTWSIIAACLAKGMLATEVTKLYFSLGPQVFRRSKLSISGLVPRFGAKPLVHFLHELFGDETMDSDTLRTGLAIMTRRYNTGSPWLISNNPRAPYWLDPPDGSYVGNRHYLLANMIRASTAAPGYFQPQLVEVIHGQPPVAFIDGGMSPYNNPSLYLLMLVQARAFGLQWKMGTENLSLISIGAGHYRRGDGHEEAPITSMELAMRALLDTLADGQLLTLTLLQWFSDPPMPWKINSEIGDLSGEVLGGKPLLNFQRYDLPLEASWLNQHLSKTFSSKKLKDLRRFDSPETMGEAYALASEAAAGQVKLEHLIA